MKFLKYLQVFCLLGASALVLAACSPGVLDPNGGTSTASSSSSSGKTKKMNYWDGDLPLEARQSVQAFQRDEEPKILEFRRRLAEAGGESGKRVASGRALRKGMTILLDILKTRGSCKAR